MQAYIPTHLDAVGDVEKDIAKAKDGAELYYANLIGVQIQKGNEEKEEDDDEIGEEEDEEVQVLEEGGEVVTVKGAGEDGAAVAEDGDGDGDVESDAYLSNAELRLRDGKKSGVVKESLEDKKARKKAAKDATAAKRKVKTPKHVKKRKDQQRKHK